MRRTSKRSATRTTPVATKEMEMTGKAQLRGSWRKRSNTKEDWRGE